MATMESVKCVQFLMMLLISTLVKSQTDNGVAVKWGVADSSATVGKLFRLHIPSDAFSGNVLSLAVSRSDGIPLPRWLDFDDQNNILLGVPTPADMGQLFLEITARGANSTATASSTIYVREVAAHSSGTPLRFQAAGPELVLCQPGASETVATLILDVDLDSLPAAQRVSLLYKFLSHLQLQEAMVKMIPNSNSPIRDSSALVSGSGDCLVPKTAGLFVSWLVGCGQVKEGHFPVLQKLDDDSSSGRLAKALGQSVIGWQVTNTRFQAPARKRRQVQATATPAATPVMPTPTERQPEATEDTMTRKLVDIQSPTFIQPTSTQPLMTRTYEPVLSSVTVEDKPVKIMPIESTPELVPTSTTEETPPVIPIEEDPFDSQEKEPRGCVLGQQPTVMKRISSLVYSAGEFIDFLIPEDTFADCEVGGTRGLDLFLYKNTTSKIPASFFLQLDAGKQRLIGLPLTKDIGNHSLILVANKDTLVANTEVFLKIEDVQNRKEINHQLSVTLNLDYAKFMSNFSLIQQLTMQVASVYGDKDSRHMAVMDIQAGSVIYSWTNKSLSSSDCPALEIGSLVRKLVDEDGYLVEGAVNKLKSFNLVNVEAKPDGACKKDPNFPTVVGRPREKSTQAVSTQGQDKSTPPTTTVESIAKGSKAGEKDDILITIIIPVVVVIVILLIAILVACILHRKRRRGKMNIEEQNTFINKGAPVIFPDELEEKPSDVNKPLLVEGSASPPPDYQRGASESPERADQGNYSNLSASEGADDGITEFPEKPYEPPPPVTASSNGKQPRLSHQQPFSQAPQILP